MVELKDMERECHNYHLAIESNKDFADIRRTLDDIAERYFAIENQKVACI